MLLDWKRAVARGLLRRMLPRLRSSECPFTRLLGEAVRLQLGHGTDESFRKTLTSYYEQLDRSAWMKEFGFERKARRLEAPGGYKIDVGAGESEPSVGRLWGRLSPWHRRFGLLRHLGIRADLLILRADEHVPPHGHHRVVSGFYLLEGHVAVRHYDRINEAGDRVLVRKTVDQLLRPGGYTTNSEFHHNVHWLRGIARNSFLFRVTVTGVPTVTFGGAKSANPRVYLDPTGPADENGIVAARYVTEEAAKRLILPVENGAAAS